MKRLFTIMVCLFAMMAASLSVKAQEVTITLFPGWNWISYPNTVAMEVGEALNGFVPANGDMIKSQASFSSYQYGYWTGGITHFMPGWGYKYYSNRTEIVSLVFNTPPMPTGTLTVTTSEPNNITSTTAVCGGSAVSNDGTTILMKGVCWATHPEPTTNDFYTETESGPGIFTTTITELDPETVYYVRAYAVSVKGINYGEELSFTTVSPGVLNGLFSVSENNQVCFSQGNLQYQASTNTWRFAENQWDYIGDNTLGTVYENGVKCDNSLISSSYNGWIDLFGWGTSGHDHGAVCYQPWSTSDNNSDYYVYGNWQVNLYDQTGQADWGSNAISNGGNQPNQWRTLTREEWGYVFETRATASGIRYAKAKVNDVNGMLLLPDDWNESSYTLNNPNSVSATFTSNTITASQWNTLAFQGAVFLPASGFRLGTSIHDLNSDDLGSDGNYWSASCNESDYAYYIAGFDDSYLNTQGSLSRCFGGGVRLVRPAQTNASYSIEAVSNPTEGGTISGTGTYDYYAQATLTATANEGYTFYQWKENGNVISTENPISFVALFDRNLEACFLESNTYPLLYSYNDDDHTATVTGHWDGSNATGDLVIPETVLHNGETYTVTAIGSNAFVGYSGLTSVVIPNTVTVIGDDAFRDCIGLTSLSFGNTVTSIGIRAFWHCEGLTSVVLPNSVTFIGESAFEGCSNLTSISIPNSVTSIGNWTFSHCNSLTEVTIPNSVSHIGINPFHDCTNLAQITVELGNQYYDSRDNCNAIIETSSNSLISGSLNTVIPNSVTAICRDAFLQIPITTISIPASVVRIDMSAFALTNLSMINIYADIPPLLNDGPFYGVDKSIPVYVPCASIEAYQNANGWNEFTNIIEMCPGVVTVTANPADYGTVSGGGSFEAGETCTVTATPNEGYYFLCWMENGHVVSTEATYTFSVCRDHDMTAIFYATLGEEKVINGDFEQGNVGFSSEYEYLVESAPGGYIVDDNANMYNGGFHGLGHGGTGNFMIIDGATEPNVIVWTKQLSVVPNTYYTLSAWVCTLIPESLALLQFSINGTQIGDVFTAPSQTNTWQQFGTIWFSGNSTTATITIVDLNTKGNGNDFGLDDISFREFDPSVSGGDHAYVDLGLPSGLLWATCNVGADTPEDYGDYFAWGETQPKSDYSWSTYQYCNGNNTTMTKYCSNSDYGYNGFTDSLTTLQPSDDAATAQWGSGWRMPTKEEWQELYNNTTCTWTTQNGVNGRLFTASNGNSLFLPAAGFRLNSGLYNAGSNGSYWSSSLYTDYPYSAWDFDFGSDGYDMGYYYRNGGQSVRPVREN